MANDLKEVRTALVRALAERKISDDVINITAKQIANAKHPIRGIDVCAVGICIDFFIDGKEWQRTLPEVIGGDRIKKIEIFPWGIPNPDLLHVRVTQSLDVTTKVRG